MFIDFEGIDGSGKTTLSNRLARRLRGDGVAVTHARENGELPSPIARALRGLTRDPANVALTDVAELLLFCARDAQVVEEVVRPALARGDVVIADRYLYSHLALAVHGRGLPLSTARPIVDAVSGGLWPDLVVVVDVDPSLARLRKRAARLGGARDVEPSPSGRKSLSGPGLLARVRAGFLALARAEPERFVVLENAETSLEALEERIWSVVRPRLRARAVARPARRPGAPPPVPAVDRRPPPFDPTAADRLALLQRAFLDAVEAQALLHAGSAALLLGAAAGDRAGAIRGRLARDVPAAVVRGLGAADGEAALDVREELADRVPRAVAASLAGIDHPRASALRRRLASRAPAEVAASLAGLDDAEAWELRARLRARAPDAVVRSLAGLGRPEAWRLRADPGVPPEPVLASLARLDGERAWALRDELAPRATTIALLQGLAGCTSDRAFELREAWLSRAPRPVLRGLKGLDHPRAWSLRTSAGPGAKEALDSIAGMGGGRAMSLRRELAARWPANAIASVVGLDPEEVAPLVWEILAAYGGHLPVLRAAALRLAGLPRLREAA